jgi:glycosyltransferase involved in cell wall biosynthesis
MPSTGEGFGIVFLEAMGCGCPVVAGNRDGSVDALDNGKLGLLIDPLDVEAIAEAITGILQRQGNPVWLNPDALHNAAAQRFGPRAFSESLQRAMPEIFRGRAADA